MKSANSLKRTSEARRRRKKDSTMLGLPSHPLRGPKRRTKSGNHFPQAVRTPTTHAKPKVSKNDYREKMTIPPTNSDIAFTCRKTATVRKPSPTTASSPGRLPVSALSESNRFVNHRPCTEPSRPTMTTSDTRRGDVTISFTKNEKRLAVSVTNRTRGPKTKTPEITHTKHDFCLWEG